MKWIGQHIWDFISRFRSDVYLENIEDGTVASDKFLGLDSNNKIVKETVSTTVTDLHSAGVDGSANQLLTDDGDGTVTSEPNLTWDGDFLNIGSSTANRPSLSLTNNTNDDTGPSFNFYNLRDGNGLENDDTLGSINFSGEDDAGNNQRYADIHGYAASAANGDEAGKLKIEVTANGLTNFNGATFTGDPSSSKVDVLLGYGGASLTTIAGDLLLESSQASNPWIEIKNTLTTSDQAGILKFTKDATAFDGSHDDVADGEWLGIIDWYGDNDAGTPEQINYTRILGSVADMTDGQEAGKLELKVAEYDGTLTTGIEVNGDTNADGEVDVTIGAGVGSTTTITGGLKMLEV